MTDAQGPLAGMRIVEFDAIGPAPLAAMILADLGADVVRVCRGGGGFWENTGGAVLNRNRPHLNLDLKAPEDRDRALDLVGRADALIEGFRPGVMERLGLGPDACLTRNPRLAYVRMTGWGQSGPLAQRAGHDLNYIALTGALQAMGSPDAPPPVPLNLVGDYGGGAMFAVVGLLSAVTSARTTGRGQVVDAAMTDGTSVLSSLFHALAAGGLWTSARGSNLLDGGAPFYRCYACADGGFVAVGALEPPFFAALVAGLKLDFDPAAQYDQTRWPDLAAALESAFAARPRDHWTAVFQDTDACVTPVLSFAEAAAHPHLATRETLPSIDGLTQPAPAPRLSLTPGRIDPARRGETTFDALIDRWRD
ncbi:MAG: CaiB/BaiF CoA transferase family protein [Brevundimonas sp.]|uniref:CaiB/BaiF CoA transferase family protein n=1 Tax=Brevundimonas sp. TaxID=1871086 RepID=UPI0040345388